MFHNSSHIFLKVFLVDVKKVKYKSIMNPKIFLFKSTHSPRYFIFKIICILTNTQRTCMKLEKFVYVPATQRPESNSLLLFTQMFKIWPPIGICYVSISKPARSNGNIVHSKVF